MPPLPFTLHRKEENKTDSVTNSIYESLSIIEGLAESVLDECAAIKYGGVINGTTGTRTTFNGGVKGDKKTAEEEIATKSPKEIPPKGVCCRKRKGKNCRFQQI